MVVTVTLHEGVPLVVDLPQTVTLELVEADPVVKGQTASSSYKPGKLENGRRVLIPPHIEAGTRIVVNTATAPTSNARRTKMVAVRSAVINVMAAAARKAGRGLIRDFGEVENLQVSQKGPSDFVSTADLKAEKTLR
jgi:hypothetical protein